MIRTGHCKTLPCWFGNHFATGINYSPRCTAVGEWGQLSLKVKGAFIPPPSLLWLHCDFASIKALLLLKHFKSIQNKKRDPHFPFLPLCSVQKYLVVLQSSQTMFLYIQVTDISVFSQKQSIKGWDNSHPARNRRERWLETIAVIVTSSKRTALMSDTGKEETTVSIHYGLTKGAICSSFLMKSSPL